jgi:hypothetical protein
MKRRGCKRPNVAVSLPASIFVALRSIGIADYELSNAIGVPRPTITRVCAGISVDLSLSREEFARLKAFVKEGAELAEKAVALFALARPI